MLRRTFLAAIAAMIMASGATAATITYTLDLLTPGQFTLYAEVSAGDNAGLASYSVPLLGTVTNLNNHSPLSINSTGFAPLGFDQFRLPAAGTDPIAAPLPNPTIRGSQNSISGPTGNFIYGLGQEASSFALKGYTTLGAAQDATSDQAWNAKIRLGSGNYTGSTDNLNFDSQNVNLTGNVWGAADGTRTTPPADTLNLVKLVPEPSTFSLLGLAMVGCFGMIRRRSA